jgi:hypothetical protein
MTRTFRFSALALAALALTACGGGGGSSTADGSGNTPAPVSAAPTPTRAAQTVRLAGLSIKGRDTLVQTASATTVASLMFKASSIFAENALAATNTINPGINFGFTSKVDASGHLVGLSVKLKPVDGSALACSDATAEVKIDRTYKVATAKDHVIALLTYPSLINADCTVGGWSQGTFVVAVGDAINPAANVTDLTLSGDAVARIVPAGDQAFNTSPNALAVYASGRLREIFVADTTGVTMVTDLTPDTLPIRTRLDGQFAYNGTELVGLPKDRNDVALVFTKGQSGFKQIAIRPDETKVPATGYPGTGVMIDDQGHFVWVDYAELMRELDTTAGTYKQWWAVAPTPTNSQMWGFTGPNLYGTGGRVGTTMMDGRCQVWNYSTNVVNRLTQPDDPTGAQRANPGALYSRLTSDGMAICAGAHGNIFARFDVNTGALVYFNTDNLGIFNSPSRKFDVYQDRVMLLEAVSTATADVKIIELNFNTGLMTDHGTVQVADRKVVSLVPTGN